MSEKKNKIKSKETSPINSAINQGIENLIEQHPRFANFQDYLTKHIDNKKIQEKYNELIENIDKKGIKDKNEAVKYIAKELSDYVSSGDVLDEKGKEVILKNSLEEKTGFFHRLFKSKNRGEKYLDNTMEAFQDLYELFKSGDYAKRMPELTESVTVLHDLNFLDPAVDVLKSYGLIDSKKHKFLKENIYQRAGEESSKVVSGIEKYIVPQKVAASIIGLLGVFMITFNSKITGAVIGVPDAKLFGFVGIVMILMSLGLFLRITNIKRKFKN